MRYTFSYIIFVSLLSLAFLWKAPDFFAYPDYFPELQYNVERNPITTEKTALGRALFFDPILSKDSTISCASCHSPFNAFAHTDHDLSHGIRDQIGTRNAPAIFNMAWKRNFMRDGVINNLDLLALAPISDQKEMDSDIDLVVERLQESVIYPSLFNAAFGDSTITGPNVLRALSQFQLSLISANSKYDQVKRGEAKFTDQEKNGYALFQKNCSSCHQEPLFTNDDLANNGLPIDTTLNDFGRWDMTQLSEDSLLFVVPSLRNLSFTYPYMHDGRFKKIRQVLDHYTDGIHHSPTLSKELKKPILLSPNEKTDLIAFLLTLDDKSFVFDQKHQFPREILLQK